MTHHRRCATYIDPLTRCTCEREARWDARQRHFECFTELTPGDTRVHAFRKATDAVRLIGFGFALGYGRANRRYTSHGSYLEHFFHCDSSRYQVELALNESNNGWQQWDTDQDAWYYGTWVNFSRRMIACYAEGDLYLQIALDDDTYKAEIAALRSFHGKPPVVAVAIDEEGCQTTYEADWPVYEGTPQEAHDAIVGQLFEMTERGTK